MCFKLLLSRHHLENGLNGKHDEWEFTGLNIVWVGTILDGISWIGFFLVAIVLGGNFPCENCPSQSYPEWEISAWELSGWELSWVGLFRMEIVRVGIVRWEISRWQYFGNERLRNNSFNCRIGYRIHKILV